MTCSVIIKTHNSQKYLPLCLQSLWEQSHPPDQVIIVDSASQDPSYLQPFRNRCDIHILQEDIGFCRGNNLGYRSVRSDLPYVLILNPDAFLTPRVLEELSALMDRPENNRVGAVTGTLLGYDIEKKKPTGLVDSTGVFRTWYGRWYDRGQRVENRSLENIPAICGAFMFCRKQALDHVLIQGGIFDSQFFMYKEDIDLSLRLRKQGWELLLNPNVEIYHCRGWNPNRRMVPRKYRLLSARNDMRIDQKNSSPYFFVSLMKYLAVKLLDV